MRGNKIGNYRFYRTLGEGSFAKVKRKLNIYIKQLVGVQEIINQKVAAKFLQKSSIRNKDLEDKIKREIRFSKYFRHPNIIRLYEVIETNSEIILIMENAAGGELFDMICRGKVKIKYIKKNEYS